MISLARLNVITDPNVKMVSYYLVPWSLGAVQLGVINTALLYRLQYYPFRVWKPQSGNLADFRDPKRSAPTPPTIQEHH
jgi:hypothetical protein